MFIPERGSSFQKEKKQIKTPSTFVISTNKPNPSMSRKHVEFKGELIKGGSTSSCSPSDKGKVLPLNSS
jgi:hypothetical protein